MVSEPKQTGALLSRTIVAATAQAHVHVLCHMFAPCTMWLAQGASFIGCTPTDQVDFQWLAHAYLGLPELQSFSSVELALSEPKTHDEILEPGARQCSRLCYTNCRGHRRTVVHSP